MGNRKITFFLMKSKNQTRLSVKFCTCFTIMYKMFSNFRNISCKISLMHLECQVEVYGYLHYDKVKLLPSRISLVWF